MHTQIRITEDMPQDVTEAVTSTEFAEMFTRRIYSGAFQVSAPADRPAEYTVERKPVIVANIGYKKRLGLVAFISGVSRSGELLYSHKPRTAETFREVASKVLDLLEERVKFALKGHHEEVSSVDTWVIIELDGEVEVEPGKFSRLFESEVRNISAL